jgi:hypothetical protein
MKMVIALLFFTATGDIDETKTMYFKQLESCRWYCSRLSRQQSYYTPTVCTCQLRWVELSAKVI